MMLRRTFICLLPIAVAICANAAQESGPEAATATTLAKAERPHIKVGDQWTFACADTRKYEVTRVITAVEQTGIKSTVNGQQVVMDPDLNVIESTRFQYSPSEKDLSFPLEVGKRWTSKNSYVDHNPDGRVYSGAAEVSVKVVSYEKVRVPAGEFDAFKLISNHSFQDPSNHVSGVNVRTYWYAAQARAVVKSEMRWQYAASSTCEMTQMRLQP